MLGSFNLVKYLTEDLKFDWEKFEADIPHVVRAMDNVVDKTTYPLKAQDKEAKAKRRMGLGVTALANTGEAMGMIYGSPEFNKWHDKLERVRVNAIYQASAQLAEEKGSFPLYDAEKYLEGRFIKKLSKETQEMIREKGIRNSHLTSIAPTGTISLSADNISSGIEPVFSHFYDRTIQTEEGPIVERVSDYAYRELGVKGKTADECTVQEHLSVLITASKWQDSAVSKTLNVGENVTWEEFKDIYMSAWKAGCKGCTTFRAAGERYGILNAVEDGGACYIDPDTGKKTCE